MTQETTKKITPPPLPSEELEEICNRATKGKIWAIAEGKDSNGRQTWYIYTSSKQTLERLPRTFRGRQVVVQVCSRPRILKS